MSAPDGQSKITIECPFDETRLRRIGEGFVAPQPGEGWRLHLECRTCGRDYFLTMTDRGKRHGGRRKGALE